MLARDSARVDARGGGDECVSHGTHARGVRVGVGSRPARGCGHAVREHGGRRRFGIRLACSREARGRVGGGVTGQRV